MPQDPERDDVHRAIEALQRLSEIFALRRRQLAAEVGIPESQWRLLEEIADEDFMPSMFARRRECSPAAVSRGLRGLLETGLVESSIGEDDARQRVYRLTPEGRALLRRLRTRRERAIAAIWQRFSGAELERFVRFANALTGSLESYAASRASRAGPDSPRRTRA